MAPAVGAWRSLDIGADDLSSSSTKPAEPAVQTPVVGVSNLCGGRLVVFASKDRMRAAIAGEPHGVRALNDATNHFRT